MFPDLHTETSEPVIPPLPLLPAQAVAACYDGTYSAKCPLPPSGVDYRTIAIVFAVCAVVLGTIIAVCVWQKYIR